MCYIIQNIREVNLQKKVSKYFILQMESNFPYDSMIEIHQLHIQKNGNSHPWPHPF